MKTYKPSSGYYQEPHKTRPESEPTIATVSDQDFRLQTVSAVSGILEQTLLHLHS